MKRLFFLACLLLPTAVRAAEMSADVAVYGGTPGGIAAALAAAKSGSRVLLLEPTPRLGGLLASGLSHTDYHSYESLTGPFLDFSLRVKAHYIETYGADSPQVQDSHEGVFGEPKVNLLVLEQMLKEQERAKVRHEAASSISTSVPPLPKHSSATASNTTTTASRGCRRAVETLKPPSSQGPWEPPCAAWPRHPTSGSGQA